MTRVGVHFIFCFKCFETKGLDGVRVSGNNVVIFEVIYKQIMFAQYDHVILVVMIEPSRKRERERERIMN